MLSRLLYANPVCLLTSQSVDKRNVMTISWLTPLDNHGHFICSINQKRCTTTILEQSKRFVLNVPIQGQEELIIAIGSCTGFEVEKLEKLKLDTIEISSDSFGIRDMVAYIECIVLGKTLAFGHGVYTCEMVQAKVRPGYWNGKQFTSTGTLPPLLSFLGTKQFASITRIE
jgi:flavin reductase (DIM6/NTAB) family NADH-FMN oxidoreductase RutF